MATTVTERKFKITVEQITSTEAPTKKEILVEERHYTDTEVKEGYHWMRDEPGKHTKKVYGEKDSIHYHTEAVKVYEQIIVAGEFNLADVIKAANSGAGR